MKLDFTVLFRDEYPQLIINGLLTTIELAVITWILAFGIGASLAVIRMSNKAWLRSCVACYVEYHQTVPLLVQIFLWYFGVSAILPTEWQRWINHHNGEFIFAFIAMGLAMSAYMSEDLRGGIRSIPTSQMEASRALGLSYLKTAKLVILPQALRVALPALINHSVLLFKNTSLAMAIGLAELTYETREIESQSFQTVEVYLFTTVTYLLISLCIMAAGNALEKRYRIKAR